MPSIFQQALGDRFAELHPQLQRRFMVGLDSGEACVGEGVMERVWHGGPLVRPFLALAGREHVLVPVTGRRVPFRIENVPYVDPQGRETVSFTRTFQTRKGPRRFDATMTFQGGRIVDVLGRHQHLVTPLDLEVLDGALQIRSGPLHLAALGVPAWLGGTALVTESYDTCFRIAVTVTNPRFGRIFGYWGSFTARYVPLP